MYGIRTFGGAKAWPLKAFDAEPVINDSVGLLKVVLIGDAAKQTVRAYERDDLLFTGDQDGLTSSGSG